MEYNVSRHCIERYAERIKDKDSKADINVFISAHIQMICEDVNKMVEFGTKVYEGRATNGEYNKSVVQVYLKDTWVVIVDPAKKNVITLFQIDLGLGDDFNKEYVEKLKSKLDAATEIYKQKCEEVDSQCNEWREVIADNTRIINENKRINNSLEDQNTAYEKLIKEAETNKELAEIGIRELVGVLTSKKIF